MTPLAISRIQSKSPVAPALDIGRGIDDLVSTAVFRRHDQLRSVLDGGGTRSYRMGIRLS
jgi:hypothetical protein